MALLLKRGNQEIWPTNYSFSIISFSFCKPFYSIWFFFIDRVAWDLKLDFYGLLGINQKIGFKATWSRPQIAHFSMELPKSQTQGFMWPILTLVCLVFQVCQVSRSFFWSWLQLTTLLNLFLAYRKKSVQFIYQIFFVRLNS